jgi:hypothetical protein
VFWLILSFSAASYISIPAGVHAADAPADPGRHNDLLRAARFIQIPGPNPILVPGDEGAWDGGVIEAADALKDLGTYYFYYHGTGSGKGYRLGVATASHPLGPFRKHGDNPVLDLGSKGSWDDRHVACAMILKEGIDRYLMWYSGHGASPKHRGWSIGLATARSPVGPWKKHPDNPIIKNFGYVGGVVKVKGKYYLYTAHPIGSTGPDYSPMALATAEHPSGPWTRWPKNPVLRQGEWGEWDDGGYSEGEVLYFGGVFHMFYGGAKLFPERIRTRECIGYAYSTDGTNFIKYGRNPVATRMANPNAAAFAEVHAIYEAPLVYLYHTLRYKQPRTAADRARFPGVENLGVQVLATATPFRLDMPVLSRKTLRPKTTTSLLDSPPVCLDAVSRVALTVECTHSKKATSGIRIRVRSSYDGIHYDSTDLCRFDERARPGWSWQKTFELDTGVRCIKVLVENTDPSEAVSDLKVTATLGG